MLPRTPAFLQLIPDPQVFEPVAAELAEAIVAVTAIAGQVERAVGPTTPPEGFYRLQPEDGSPPCFVKVVVAADTWQHYAADRIARGVVDHGVSGTCLLVGYPRIMRGGFAALAYPYVPARFADQSADDMRALGGALARLHTALAALPQATEVRLAWDRRLETMRRRRAAVLAGEHPAGVDWARLRGLLEAENGLHVDDEMSQIIHGDLVYGNVLFPDDGGGPCFVDFEDSTSSWLPPWIDLAQALERFVLAPLADDADAERLGATLIDAYRDAGGVSPPTDDWLLQALRLINVRTLCLLAESAAVGRTVLASEWNKFFDLHAQAEKRAKLLGRLAAHATGALTTGAPPTGSGATGG